MKKQLLQESEIRKMMKFANIGALTNGFVDRLTEASEMEEDLEEGAPSKEDIGKLVKGLDDTVKKSKKNKQTDEGMDMGDEGMDMGDEDLDMGDEDLDMDVEEPAADGEMELSQEEAEVLIALGTRLSGEMDMEGGEEELPMPDEEEGMDMAGEEDELPPEMEEDMINEVARRVSRRLAARRG
jgi:hypothetical protein